MTTSDLKVPVRPLQVEIDGVGRYRQAFYVDDLAALLLGGWPPSGKTDPAFHRSCDFARRNGALRRRRTAREGFVRAAHTAGMHVLPDDMAEMRKAG